jgi:hypothetical protein
MPPTFLLNGKFYEKPPTPEEIERAKEIDRIFRGAYLPTADRKFTEELRKILCEEREDK